MISNIPSSVVKSMKLHKIWTSNCPIDFSRLRLLTIKHYNFDGKIQTGKIIVLDKVAESVLKIFGELLVLNFPIQSVQLIDDYNGNDELSMEANNSSAFNFRQIVGSSDLSMHSYGLAIDLNPVQNPYIIIKKDNSVDVFPKNAVNFLNRYNKRKGMVEPIVEIFNKYGFSEWGGNWNKPIDYHHFQVPRSKISEFLST